MKITEIEPNILISFSLFLSSITIIENFDYDKYFKNISTINAVFGVILGFIIGSILSPYNFREKIDERISFIRTIFLVVNFIIYTFFNKKSYSELFWYTIGVWLGFVIFSIVQYNFGKFENRWYKYSDYTIYLLYINVIYNIISFVGNRTN